MAENTVLENPKVKQIASLTVAECSEFHSMGEEHTGVSSAKEAIEIFKSIPPERMNGIPAIGVRVTNADSPELFTEIDIFRGNRFDMEVLDYVPEIRDDWNAQKMIAELIHAYPKAEILGDIPEGVQKKLQFIESKERQANQLKDVTDQLEKGVADIFQSDKYKEYLNVMAKFPHYSVNNSILIMMQKPDAQICQSYTGWKEMGRYVKKGEKGINILAPAPYKIEREQQKLDANGKPMFDRDGEPITEKVEVTIRAFKVVKTFDVSQTDGKELPTLGVNELVGNIDGYPKLLEALQAVCPVPVSFENIPDNSKGYFHLMDKRIVVQDGMSEVQTIKTLIHEMAHQKLHDKDLVAEAANISRNGKEVEAESVAYVVCQHFGINTSDYSFSYVAGWSEGKETPELKASLGKIRETAADFISRIDEKLEELVSQKTQEQVTEQQVSVKEDKSVNRKEELAQLLSATAAQCSVDGKSTPEKKTTKKESVKLKIQSVKELPKKEPAKKSKTKAKEERA